MNLMTVLREMKLLLVSLLLLLSLGVWSAKKEECEYIFRNSTTNEVCTHLNMSAVIHIKYTQTDNSSAFIFLPVPCLDDDDDVDVNVSGLCNVPDGKSKHVLSNTLQISWENYDNDTYIGNTSLQFNFTDNTNNKEWTISNISVTVNVSNLNDSKENMPVIRGFGKSSSFGHMDYKRSFRCESNITINLKLEDTIDNITNNDPHLKMSVSLADLTVQAFHFHNKTEGEYGRGYVCFQDIEGSKLIPIIVGSIIGGGVLVVLGIYIGSLIRKNVMKNKRKSYQTLSTQ